MGKRLPYNTVGRECADVKQCMGKGGLVHCMKERVASDHLVRSCVW